MAGLSLLLFLVSLLSFQRVRDSKLFFVTLAFFLFFLKGVIIALRLLEQNLYLVMADLIIIFFLYLTIVKK
jgi:hypothetical protein